MTAKLRGKLYCACCALCQRKSFGCAPILSRFLVAPLFHYLIGKKKGFPLLAWFPLPSQGSQHFLDITYSVVEVLVWFGFVFVWLWLWAPTVSSSAHGIFGKWNRKSHCLSLPTADVLHTLRVVTVMFNLSPKLCVTVFLLVFASVYVKYTLHAVSIKTDYRFGQILPTMGCYCLHLCYNYCWH